MQTNIRQYKTNTEEDKPIRDKPRQDNQPTRQDKTRPGNKRQCKTIQDKTRQYNTMQYKTIQAISRHDNTMRDNAIQCKTTTYKTN